MANRERRMGSVQKLLDAELEKYTQIQANISGALSRIKELERLGIDIKGREESELSVLRAAMVGLKEQARLTTDNVRRLKTRIDWTYE